MSDVDQVGLEEGDVGAIDEENGVDASEEWAEYYESLKAARSAVVSQFELEDNPIDGSPGVFLWEVTGLQADRMEEFPQTLSSGSSYIILHTDEKHRSHVYYWVGSRSPIERAAVAAIKSNELCSYVGALAQQRVDQADGEHESKVLGLIGNPTVKEGENKSALAPADQTENPKVLQVSSKGALREVCACTGSLSSSPMTSCVVFSTKMIFVVHGSQCSVVVRVAASRLARDIKAFLQDRVEIKTLTMGESSNLPESLSGIFESDGDGGAAAACTWEHSDPAVYHVSMDEDSGASIDAQDFEGKLSLSLLSGPHATIVDFGDSIYIWHTKETPIDTRFAAQELASQFIEHYGRPEWTPIQKIQQHSEPPYFLWRLRGGGSKLQNSSISTPEHFEKQIRKKSRLAKSLPIDDPEEDAFGAAVDVSNVSGIQQTSNSATDAFNQQVAAAEHLNEELGAEVMVWIVDSMDSLREVESPGQFFSGDCYIALVVRDEKAHGFFWKGSKSTVLQDRAWHNVLREKLQRMVGKFDTMVEMQEGNETPEFMALFPTGIVIRRNSESQGFRLSAGSAAIKEEASRQQTSEDSQVIICFDVRAFGANYIVSHEVEGICSSLDSLSCIVMQTEDGQTSVWIGAASTHSTQSAAMAVAEALEADVDSIATIDEGSESDDFWQILGGKKDYRSAGAMAMPFGAKDGINVRLFAVNCTLTPTEQVEELFPFNDKSFDGQSFVLIVAGMSAFIWFLEPKDIRHINRAAAICKGVLQKISADGKIPKLSRAVAGAEPELVLSAIRAPGTMQTRFVDPHAARRSEIVRSLYLEEEKAKEQRIIAQGLSIKKMGKKWSINFEDLSDGEEDVVYENKGEDQGGNSLFEEEQAEVDEELEQSDNPSFHRFHRSPALSFDHFTSTAKLLRKIRIERGREDTALKQIREMIERESEGLPDQFSRNLLFWKSKDS